MAKRQTWQARERLLSDHPPLKRERQKATEHYEATTAQIAEQLARNQDISRGLAQLKRAGAAPDKVLTLLALVLHPVSWMDGIPPSSDRMKSLARKLRSVADEAERVSGDPESYLESYKAMEVRDCPPIQPTSERVPRELLAAMRSYADDLDAEARRFGDFLKAERPRVRREAEMFLLAWIHKQTGDAHLHLQILAEMLHAASERYRVPCKATADSLRQTLKRHVLPRFK